MSDRGQDFFFQNLSQERFLEIFLKLAQICQFDKSCCACVAWRGTALLHVSPQRHCKLYGGNQSRPLTVGVARSPGQSVSPHKERDRLLLKTAREWTHKADDERIKRARSLSFCIHFCLGGKDDNDGDGKDHDHAGKGGVCKFLPVVAASNHQDIHS